MKPFLRFLHHSSSCRDFLHANHASHIYNCLCYSVILLSVLSTLRSPILEIASWDFSILSPCLLKRCQYPGDFSGVSAVTPLPVSADFAVVASTFTDWRDAWRKCPWTIEFPISINTNHCQCLLKVSINSLHYQSWLICSTTTTTIDQALKTLGTLKHCFCSELNVEHLTQPWLPSIIPLNTHASQCFFTVENTNYLWTSRGLKTWEIMLP